MIDTALHLAGMVKQKEKYLTNGHYAFLRAWWQNWYGNAKIPPYSKKCTAEYYPPYAGLWTVPCVAISTSMRTTLTICVIVLIAFYMGVYVW